MLKRQFVGARGLITFGLLLASIVCLKGSTPVVSQPFSVSTLADGLPPEVRLRKLHLVRPDLIPYPIDYEVVC